MSKRFRILLSFVMLGVVLFTALPKVYIHKLLGHTHIIEDVNKKNGVEINKIRNTTNCELEKFETPVYFTIFRIIQNCNPIRRVSAKISYKYTPESAQKSDTSIALLRGPPTV